MARLSLNSRERAAVLKRVAQGVRDAEDKRAVKLQTLSKWRRYYEQDMPKADENWPFKDSCRVVVPFIRPATDAIADRLGRTTFGVDPFFIVKGQNDPADDLLASYLQKGLQWYMQRMRFPARMDRGNTLVARDGVAWAVIRYVNNTTWVKRRSTVSREVPVVGGDGMPMLNGATGQPFMQSITEETAEWQQVSTYKGPEVKICAAEDAGVYPATATSADEVEGFYRRVTRTLREWRELQRKGLYSNVEALEKSVLSDSEQKEEQQRKEGLEPGPRPNDDDATPKTAYECIWKWRVKGGPDAWFVFTISLEPEALLRAEDYWYWHGRPNVVPLRILPRQDSLYGYSIPELCYNLQEEMNALVRQHTDAGTVSNTVTTIGGRNTGMQNTRMQIGIHNHVDDPASTQLVRFPGPDGSLTGVFGMLDKLGQRLVGTNDLSYGSFPGGEVKATEVNAVRAEADIKFSQHMARYQFGSGALLYGEGLNEVALQTLCIMHQYCGESLQRILGADPFAVVPLADIISEFDVSAKAVTPRSNTDVEKQTRLAFASVLTGNPMFQQLVMADPARAHALAEWVAEPHDIHGLERFIGSAQQAAQGPPPMAMAQMAAAGGGTPQGGGAGG